jgi:hypothetical protein
MQTNMAIEEFSSLFGEQRVKNTLKKMADIEISHCRLDLKNARASLRPFEDRFQMTSRQAWEHFNNGQLGDELDIMEWMGLYENFLHLELQLKRIMESRAYAEFLHSTHAGFGNNRQTTDPEVIADLQKFRQKNSLHGISIREMIDEGRR